MNERLYRSVDDRVIAGVCGGLAIRFALDPSLVRILWVVVAIVTGVFPLLVLYVIMAAVVPEEPGGFAGAWPSPTPPGAATGPLDAPIADGPPRPLPRRRGTRVRPAQLRGAASAATATRSRPPSAAWSWWRWGSTSCSAIGSRSTGASSARPGSLPWELSSSSPRSVRAADARHARHATGRSHGSPCPGNRFGAGATARLQPVEDTAGLVVALALLGLVGGLVLLARGLRAYGRAGHVAGIGTSRIATLAAGEIRLVGAVEADVMTLVSPLQSVPCIYYRARIREGSGDETRTVFGEERAVGFRLRDASGSIRVLPNGARWDAPLRFDAASDWAGADPPGLDINPGAAYRRAELDREAQIAALLTVRPPADSAAEIDGQPGLFAATLGGVGAGGPRRRHYEERRLVPGETVTILGSALPFGDLESPARGPRGAAGDLGALDDPEVAMNLAAAREVGILRSTAEEAWGNAAIPGFGIGRPARAPELDPGADHPDLASPAESAAAETRFEIPAGELVVAAAPDRPLAILAGTPGEARQREEATVLLGLVGAAVAIVGATTLALTLSGLTR